MLACPASFLKKDSRQAGMTINVVLFTDSFVNAKPETNFLLYNIFLYPHMLIISCLYNLYIESNAYARTATHCY